MNPCESPDHFIGDNGSSCLLNCPHPFEVRTKYGIKFCINPCLSEQYYFDQNKSCLNDCPSPFKITSQGGLNSCQNPCSKSDFLYDDQLCYESCPVPLMIKERNYCQSPCIKEFEYINADGDCQETCNYPKTVIKKGSYQFCVIDISQYQIHQVNLMKKIVTVSNLISETVGILSCFFDPSDTTSIFAMPLLGIFEKAKYIGIILPADIQLIYRNEDLRNTFDKKLGRIGILCLLKIVIRHYNGIF